MQPAAASGAETISAATVVSPVTKADIQPQAQPIVQQQTTPPSVVSTTSQQAAKTPSSPAPPQRPSRRKQAGQAQQPAAQPSPSKPAPGQPLVPVQQQVTQPSAAQAQAASAEINQKAAETVSFFCSPSCSKIIIGVEMSEWMTFTSLLFIYIYSLM